MDAVNETQHRLLLTFRCALRDFEHRSDLLCAAVGLSPQHHQLLLAVRGHPGPEPPSIGDLSRYLFIRHHSTVGLVNRAQRAGLVVRCDDDRDQRVVRVTLAPSGHQLVERLAADHLLELRQMAERLEISQDVLVRLSQDYLGATGVSDDSAAAPGAARGDLAAP